MRKFTCVPCLSQGHNKYFFLLLLGLRVSQFSGQKCGATPYPTQKTITNFITSGEANRKNSSFSDVTDYDFVTDTETDLSLDGRHTGQLDSRDPFDGNHSLDVNYQSSTLRKTAGAEKVYLPFSTLFFLLSSDIY